MTISSVRRTQLIQGPPGPPGSSNSTASTTFTIGAGGSAPLVLNSPAPVTTIDGTTWVTLALVPLLADQSVDLPCSFFARNTGATGGTKGDTFGFDLRSRWKRVGTAAPVAVGATPTPSNADGDAGENAIAAQFVASGNNVAIQVKGVAAHTLTFAMRGTEQFR